MIELLNHSFPQLVSQTPQPVTSTSQHNIQSTIKLSNPWTTKLLNYETINPHIDHCTTLTTIPLNPNCSISVTLSLLTYLLELCKRNKTTFNLVKAKRCFIGLDLLGLCLTIQFNIWIILIFETTIPLLSYSYKYILTKTLVFPVAVKTRGTGRHWSEQV